jgi:ABC-type sugar transport system substrate-binding protein
MVECPPRRHFSRVLRAKGGARAYYVRRRLAVALAGLFAVSLVLSACSSGSAGSGSTVAGTAKHFNILVSPYWLDVFGSEFVRWFEADAEAHGDKVTVVNPDATLSNQVNALDQAIGSKQYNGVVWQPIDVNAEKQIIANITKAGIPQALSGIDPSLDLSVNVPRANYSYESSTEQMVEDGAQEVIKVFHQAPRVVFMQQSPLSPDCIVSLAALKKGLAAVSPHGTIVYDDLIPDGSATATLNAMTQFITTDVPFNMVLGCGPTQAYAISKALTAAGRGKAINKVPQTEVQLMSGSAPELALLWSPNSSAMYSLFQPVKPYADAMYTELRQMMTGQKSLTNGEADLINFTVMNSDCPKWRAYEVSDTAGVRGVTIPACGT